MKIKILFLLIIVIIVSSSEGFSQRERIVCKGKIISFTNGNINHFLRVACCPLVEHTQNTFPKRIMDSANSYLIHRVGKAFIEKINQPIYQELKLELMDSIRTTNPCVSIENCHDTTVKYVISYNFNLPKGMKYYFTLLYNRNGELISNEQLPEFELSINSFNFIEPCIAIEITDKDSVYKQRAKNITLDFSQKLNAFVWIVEKEESINRFNEYTIPTLVLNATNGRILERYLNKRMLACHQKRINITKAKK